MKKKNIKIIVTLTIILLSFMNCFVNAEEMTDFDIKPNKTVTINRIAVIFLYFLEFILLAGGAILIGKRIYFSIKGDGDNKKKNILLITGIALIIIAFVIYKLLLWHPTNIQA